MSACLYVYLYVGAASTFHDSTNASTGLSGVAKTESIAALIAAFHSMAFHPKKEPTTTVVHLAAVIIMLETGTPT